MPVQAKYVISAALKLTAHANESGDVDESRESRYYGLAPAYLTLLQSELALCENLPVPSPVTGPDDTLAVSDETAVKTLPAGLAMYFALIDRDSELYNHFSRIYYSSLMPSARAAETTLNDVYGVLQDPSFQ